MNCGEDPIKFWESFCSCSCLRTGQGRDSDRERVESLGVGEGSGRGRSWVLRGTEEEGVSGRLWFRQ